MRMQESWLCLGYDTSGTARAMLGIPHVLPPPVLHLCRARCDQTPWNKLGAKINFTAYPWCMKTKTFHGNCVSNNSQVPRHISGLCQANGEEATFFVCSNAPGLCFMLIHILVLYVGRTEVQKCLHKQCCLAP